MKPHRTNSAQGSFLLPDLASQLDPCQALYCLAMAIDWKSFEDAFGPLYSAEGRPALPIRRMVGLLMLKHLQNLSDERVVDFWSLSPYAQFFCGEREMQWGLPCEASELVHFRNRIGPDGAEKIFASTIELHGEKAKEKEVVVDTTTQEKNITYPTDTKLAAKILRGGSQVGQEKRRHSAPEFRANGSETSCCATWASTQERSAEGKEGITSFENNRLARGSTTRQRSGC